MLYLDITHEEYTFVLAVVHCTHSLYRECARKMKRERERGEKKRECARERQSARRDERKRE